MRSAHKSRLTVNSDRLYGDKLFAHVGNQVKLDFANFSNFTHLPI